MTAQLASQLQDALGSDYRVEQELAGGGMSRLFIATDLRHDRRVVVKVLSPELVSNESTARFKREIELTVRLQHPHILPILTSGSWEDVLYYITPFIPGESLKARIEREKKLPLDDIVKILRDVSGALAFAHQRGIVHRDVKPGNILLAEGHAILADFGIARALVTNATPLTGSGMTPGTPAYMAPELPTDEKADVYALGVVAYEMLTGVLPKRGASFREIAAERKDLPGDRPPLQRTLTRVVARALSPDIATRYVSALEVHRDLERLPTVAQWKSVAIRVAALMVVVAGGLVAALLPHGSTLDPATVAVGSFSVESSVDSALSGIVYQSLVGALGEWSDLRIAGVNQPSLAAESHGDRVQAALSLARSSKAATLIVGTVNPIGDSVSVIGEAYDSQSGRAIRSVRTVIARDKARSPRAFRFIANGLLRDGERLPWGSPSDASRPSLNAWRMFDRGTGMIRQWRLIDAESAFMAATRVNPEFALAHLWRAQTLAWRADTSAKDEIQASARRALLYSNELTRQDRLQADGLLAMSAGDFTKAIATFSTSVAENDSSFSAWLDLADAHRLDQTILADRGSPSRYRFESSFETAAKSYRRASDLAAGPDSAFRGWMLRRITGVLYRERNKGRRGFLVNRGDSTAMIGFLFLDGDSLAAVPWNMRDVSVGRGDPPVQARTAAIRRNRELLRSFAERWVEQSPNEPAALEALGDLAEVSGGYATVAGTRTTALSLVHQARAAAADSARWRLAVIEVRLCLKSMEFDRARSLADSILERATPRNSSKEVVAIALLRGKLHRAIELIAGGSGVPDMRVGRQLATPPPPVTQGAALLLAGASVGMPSDTLERLAARLDQLILTHVHDSSAAAFRETLLARPLSIAFPADSVRFAGIAATDNLVRAQQSVLRGDGPSARRFLAEHRARIEGYLPSSLGIDGVYRRAVLSLVLGDTLGAKIELDRALQSLPSLGSGLVTEWDQSPVFVRAMLLRARLARRESDNVTASTWLAAATKLWSDADPEIRSQLSAP